MRIKVIIPHANMTRDMLDERERFLSEAVSPGVELSVDCLPSGPDSIESHVDEALSCEMTARICIQAETDGFNAIVIYCFSDIGIDAARQLVRIPIIGPGEVALAVADIFSLRFCVVTTIETNRPRTYRRLMRKSSVAREKMASVRSLDIPVVELRDHPDATLERLRALCADATSEDGVDTIILGCTGLAQYGKALEQEFGLTVLDPAMLAVAAAEMAARLGLTHSRLVWPAYREVGRLQSE